MIANGDIALMVNTPFGHATRADGWTSSAWRP